MTSSFVRPKSAIRRIEPTAVSKCNIAPLPPTQHNSSLFDRVNTELVPRLTPHGIGRIEIKTTEYVIMHANQPCDFVEMFVKLDTDSGTVKVYWGENELEMSPNKCAMHPNMIGYHSFPRPSLAEFNALGYEHDTVDAMFAHACSVDWRSF